MGAGKSKVHPMMPPPDGGPTTQTQTTTRPSEGAKQQLRYIQSYLGSRAQKKGVVALRNDAAAVAAKATNAYLGVAKVLDFVSIPDPRPNAPTLGLHIMILQMLVGGGSDSNDDSAATSAALGQSSGDGDGVRRHHGAQVIDIDESDLNNERVKELLANAMERVPDSTANVFLVNVYTPGYKSLNFALLEWMVQNVSIVSGGLEPRVVSGTDKDGKPTPILEIPVATLGQATDRLACEATKELMSDRGVCSSCAVGGMSDDAKANVPEQVANFKVQFEAAWKASSDVNQKAFTTFKFACPSVVLSGPVVSGANVHCRALGVLVKRATADTPESFYVIAEDLSYYAMAALIEVASQPKYAQQLTWAHDPGTPGVSMITPGLARMPGVYVAASPEFMALVKGWSQEIHLLMNATLNCAKVDSDAVLSLAQLLLSKGFEYHVADSVGLASGQQARALTWQSQKVEDSMMS